MVKFGRTSCEDILPALQALYKALILCNSHLKQLYLSNKKVRFSYKGGCGVRGGTHIEVIKRRAGLGYR